MKSVNDLIQSELGDIDWYEIDKVQEHVVPHNGGDSTVNSRHEIETCGVKNTHIMDTRIKNVFCKKDETCSLSPWNDGIPSIQDGLWSHESDDMGPCCSLSYNLENISNTSALPSMNNAMCTKNHIPGVNGSMNGVHSYYPDNVASAVTGLPVSESEFKSKEDDLLYYDWPDFSNIEDIDRMFRNCDFEYGERHVGDADELSWFSFSSQNIYESEVDLESGVQLNCAGTGMLNSTLGHHDRSMNRFSNGEVSTIYQDMASNNGRLSFVHYLDINAEKCQSKSDGQAEGHHPSEQLGYHNLLASEISKSGSYVPYEFNQNASMNLYISNNCVQKERGFPSCQNSLTWTESVVKPESNNKYSSSYKDSIHVADLHSQHMNMLPCSHLISEENNVEEMFQNLKSCDSVMIENSPQQYNLSNRSHVQKKKNSCHIRKREGTGLDDTASELPMDSSISMEASSITAVNSGGKINETSFRQLQDVLDQLDIRTKLCIRDGLYRLARNAKQRHNNSHEKHSSRESSCERGIQVTESSIDFADIGDAEIDTNPIDRSIAHLLFHRPLGHSLKSSRNSASLQSHFTIVQKHVNLDKQKD